SCPSGFSSLLTIQHSFSGTGRSSIHVDPSKMSVRSCPAKWDPPFDPNAAGHVETGRDERSRLDGGTRYGTRVFGIPRHRVGRRDEICEAAPSTAPAPRRT